ncbi:E3 ubiquitin-protein ligase CCNB1IP1-like isoform X2 [Anneissia japonica]|uniref:E3 ubiquitin-protein ligase CCNB1IP1-like isoform X2 n=1 Tax=Anneissia japonica TaxID=1529436 RepID=UPI00142584A2|nr:E3 ubiquitin-protein ligase CCNB1IP1-like isoform X2 [Anneissia japonica]
MDFDMVCNSKKCRKRLSGFAWVTSCSHGAREFNKSYSCPACESNLSSKLDIIRIDLSPSEQYKSMVLAGQRPEVVLEVSARAIAFWTYQVHQERVFQEYTINKTKDRQNQMEKYYEQVISRTQSDLELLKSEISTTRKELENSEKRLNEVSGKLLERNRQYQKLQSMYDSLRRRSLSVNNLASSVQSNFSAHTFPARDQELTNFKGTDGRSDARLSPAQRKYSTRFLGVMWHSS